MQVMYFQNEKKRIKSALERYNHSENEEYRSPWRQDYARLVHSTCFRRLQGKTQLFPSSENDFFRNRLTHSLEVAQIAKDIALRINKRYFIDKRVTDINKHIDTDLVEFAALAHDLGHPPFGHQGEAALDWCMKNDGGFEGNAQTLRLLSKIEKLKFSGFKNPSGIDKNTGKDSRVGLNLTLRSLASILKYDEEIPFNFDERKEYAKRQSAKGEEINDDIRPVKGYYSAERDLVKRIKNTILKGKIYPDLKFKTIECSIMDLADDIAYSTFDLEDGLKAGFYSPLDFISADQQLLAKVANKVAKNIKKSIPAWEDKKFTWFQVKERLNDLFDKLFDGGIISSDETSLHSAIVSSYKGSKAISTDGYLRSGTTERLIGYYIRNIQYIPSPIIGIPALSSVTLNEDALIQVEILKRFTYESQIKSHRLKIAEYRGKDIVKFVFYALSRKKGHELLPADYRELWENSEEKKRIICDYVAGMTDRYLIEFYGRLTSEDPESIFKPI